MLALDGPASVAWTRAYLDDTGPRAAGANTGADRGRMGNDPHNQEIAQCLLRGLGEEPRSRPRPAAARVRHHTAAHRKYGDVQEPSRRFGQAFGIAALS